MKLTAFNELVDANKIIKGHWTLGKNHTLQYRQRGKKETVKLEGSLIAADPKALIIAVTEKQSDQKIVASLLELSGAWKMDEKNRILFHVERENQKSDVIRFTGSWIISDNQQLVYSFEEILSKPYKKEKKEILFKGYWDILAPHRLIYSLGVGSDSAFELKGAFRSGGVLAENGQVFYELGAGLKGKRQKKTIVLYGKWHILRDLEISFEIDYERGKKRTLIFDGDYKLNKDKRVQVSLKNLAGKFVGIDLVLTKEFLKTQSEAFLKFSKSFEETRVEGGMRFRW